MWKILFECQTRLLPQLVCDAFVQGIRHLLITADCIPDFERLSEALHRHTGWQVVAVLCLGSDKVFFDHLTHRRFQSSKFLRKSHELDYLEEK